jgi:hypothetical protein
MPGLCRITETSEKRRWDRHRNEEPPAYSSADARRFRDADGAKPGRCGRRPPRCPAIESEADLPAAQEQVRHQTTHDVRTRLLDRDALHRLALSAATSGVESTCSSASRSDSGDTARLLDEHGSEGEGA